MANGVYDPEPNDDKPVPSDSQRRAELADQESDASASPTSESGKSKTADAKDIKSAESGATQDSSGSGSSSSESSSDTSDQASLYNPKDKKRRSLRSYITRKRTIGLGVIGTTVGSAVFILSIVQGPMQFIQFGKVLEKFHMSSMEDFTNGRTTKFFLHLRRGGRGYAIMNTRLGRVGTRIANKMELKLNSEAGLRSIYDDRTGLLRGYEVLNSEKSIGFLADADFKDGSDYKIREPNDIPDHLVSSSNEKPIGRMIDFDDGFVKRFSSARKFTNTIVKATDSNKLAAYISARLLGKRGQVDFHPLKNITRAADQKLTEYVTKVLKAAGEKIRNGVSPPKDANLNPNDKEGNPTEGGEKAKRAGQEAQTQAEEGGKSGNTEIAKTSTVKKLAGGGAAAIGILCTVNAIGKSIGDIQYANIVLPLMRIGYRTVAIGNQIMTGSDVNLDELGALNKSLYDANKKLGWTAAKSVQAELGEPQTGPDIPASAKPSNVGNLPMPFEVTKAIFDKIGVAGDAVCSQIGQFAINALTGEIITSVVQTALQTGASAAGVNPMDYFVEAIVNYLAGDEVDVNAKGADLGNLANYGSKLAANDQAIAMGGTKLSNAEVAQLKTQSKQNDYDNYQHKSIADKLFNLNDVDSLASKALFENSTVASIQQGGFTDLLMAPIKAFSSLVHNFGQIFMPKSFAAQSDYDYGFNTYGFSLADQNDPRVQDPLENAKAVEGLGLDKLNEKYGDCFSTTINPVTLMPETKKAARYDQIPAYCNDKNDDALFRYRFYLADTINANSIACAQGDSEACASFGFGGGSSDGAASTSATAGASIDPGTAYDPSENVACAANTKDLGTQDGYHNGQIVKIKICAIPNLPSTGEESHNGFGVKGADGGLVVNSRASGAAYAMAAAAASQGVHLTAGSGFRTMSHQQSICAQNTRCSHGDYTKVAKPGTSNHQMGLAIDFSGGLTSNPGPIPGNAFWNWLTANAAKFGYKNYPEESWHWSADGH